MIRYLAMALEQLTDPRLRGVLLLGVLGALAIFALLWAAVWWLLLAFDPSAVWGLSTIVEWFGEAFDWIAGAAFIGAMLVATFLMFPAVVTIVVGLFLDRVADAVEARHYRDLGPPRAQPLGETLLSTVKFAVVVVLLNILVLPLYLALILVPGGSLVLYYLLNGYLVGREFFELAGFRRLPAGEATRLRRAYRSRVLIAGIVVTVMMTIPVVNLLAPVVGTAFMVHVVHDLMRRRRIVPVPGGTGGG
ncbi:MAG: EI24 domain-containing protein [Rhodospirillales bacterium]|nr:MAG: EI24 domain-containing protein [Rhodospirillales bacterium]